MSSLFGQTGRTAIVLAAMLCGTYAIISLMTPSVVQGQANGLNNQNSVISYPFQTRAGYDAIALIDTDSKVICIYQYQDNRSGNSPLKLLAARSYRYDTLLKDYNTAEPRPEDVKKLLFSKPEK